MTNLSKMIVLAIFVASSAFAIDGTYNGGGTWKNTKGEKGTWKRELTVKHVKNGVELKDALQVFSKGKELFKEVTESKHVTTGNGLMDVLVDGKKVGWGYCLANQCHFQGESKEKGQWEETFLMTKKALGRNIVTVQGSDAGANETVLWRGELRNK